ncbi:hypothetical protein COOONC_17478 [Cooperia oncophora]
MANDQYESLGPSKPGAPPASGGGSQEPKKQALPARTPGQTILGQFALRPGDDVDLSSERGTSVSGPEVGTAEKKSKSKESKEDALSTEKDKEKPKPKTKPVQIDIKPYVEPTMLKMCHAITLALLLISFVLMALTVVQFVDIFVWLPILFGEEEKET